TPSSFPTGSHLRLFRRSRSLSTWPVKTSNAMADLYHAVDLRFSPELIGRAREVCEASSEVRARSHDVCRRAKELLNRLEMAGELPLGSGKKSAPSRPTRRHAGGF